MNRPFLIFFKLAAFMAAFCFFLGSNVPEASAQRHLCKKASTGCGAATGAAEEEVDEEEEVEDEVPTTPTAGNVAWSFAGNLTSSSALTTTSSSSSSKTDKPDVNLTTTKTKKKSGTSYTKTGSLEFDDIEDSRRSCAWIPTEIPLYRKIIRAYYTLKFDSDSDDENGEGTVLAFLPGSTTVSSTLCGGYGEYLGFADRTSYTAMPEPRFGIEFDTDKTTSMSDPNNNHVAIVADKIKHDGTDSPACPATSAANDSSSPYGTCWTGSNTTKTKHSKTYSYPWLESSQTHKFRVEMLACAGSGTTNNCASQGCATTDVYVKTWVCPYKDSSCYNSSSFQSVESAYAGSAPTVIERCVPFNQTTYDSLIVGFTYGTSDHSSDTTYGSFAIKTFDAP
ncbi:exported hypothetical protein [Rhodospirillaceae bacterium LM-1]|nr:exported hypothetical protein [Rhodospirillaceae bacterium LM-1]